MVKPKMFRIKTGDYPGGYSFVSVDEERKIFSAMIEDMSELLPWISVYGFVPYVAFHVNMEWLDVAHEPRIVPNGGYYNMPIELVYTILKLAGVDVSKYGVTEYWKE